MVYTQLRLYDMCMSTSTAANCILNSLCSCLGHFVSCSIHVICSKLFSKVITVLQSVISSPSRSALWICYWSSTKENQLSVNCTKLNREAAIPRKSNFNKIINKNNCNLITNLLVFQKYITDYKDSYSSVLQVWKYGNKHASGWSNTSFISK